MIITREEQIKEYCASQGFPYGACSGISNICADVATDAIKWADRHPYYNQEGFTEDMFVREQAFLDNWLDEHGSFPTFSDALEWERKRVVEKACEWLKENIDAYSKVIIVENSIPSIVLTEDFECFFKRCMEG